MGRVPGAGPHAPEPTLDAMPAPAETTVTEPLETRALELLRALAGPEAAFREHQLEAVADLVERRRRVLCVQRTGWGKSAVYFLATALLRERGAGPTVLISPLLALMRNQIAAAERLGLRAVTVNSTNRDDWATVTDAARGRRGRPAAHQPRAAEQPRVPRADAAAVHRPRRPARRRRGPLRLGLGPRLPARLPPHPRRPGRPARRRRGALHDRDGERPRRGRRQRAAAGRHRGGRHGRRADRVPRPARAAQPAPRGPRPPRPRGAAGLAGDAPAAAARLGDRLLPDQARHRRRRRLAGRPGHQRGRLLRRGRRRGPRARGGAPAGQRGQGRRRDLGARDGLRQAGPRLRRPLPGALVGHRVLPAGGPRRARRRGGARGPAARRRGPGDPGLLHRHRVPGAGPRRPRARASWPPTARRRSRRCRPTSTSAAPGWRGC